MINIQPVIKQDLVVLEQIEKALFGKSGWSVDQFQKYAAVAGAKMLVAHNTFGDPIGHVCFAQDDAHAIVTNLAVARSHQRGGFGTRLMEEVVKSVRAVSDDVLIEFLVAEDNLELLMFLKGQGFRWVQTIDEPFEGKDLDGYLLFWEFIPTKRFSFTIDH